MMHLQAYTHLDVETLDKLVRQTRCQNPVIANSNPYLYTWRTRRRRIQMKKGPTHPSPKFPVVVIITWLVLTEAGDVYTWGYGDLGALGHGKGEDEYRPKKLDVFASIRKKLIKSGKPLNYKVHHVVGGGQHSAILATTGL
mmetsp:Transcript_11769/g.16708  ORF Transcript_11769/g.16708 Transcript_11769/m.16708 type:complete len:141 (-) Transcript_11769:52-474(-)